MSWATSSRKKSPTIFQKTVSKVPLDKVMTQINSLGYWFNVCPYEQCYSERAIHSERKRRIKRAGLNSLKTWFFPWSWQWWCQRTLFSRKPYYYSQKNTCEKIRTKSRSLFTMHLTPQCDRGTLKSILCGICAVFCRSCECDRRHFGSSQLTNLGAAWLCTIQRCLWLCEYGWCVVMCCVVMCCGRWRRGQMRRWWLSGSSIKCCMTLQVQYDLGLALIWGEKTWQCSHCKSELSMMQCDWRAATCRNRCADVQCIVDIPCNKSDTDCRPEPRLARWKIAENWNEPKNHKWHDLSMLPSDSDVRNSRNRRSMMQYIVK